MERLQCKGELGEGDREGGKQTERKRDSVALMVGEIRFALLEKGEQIFFCGYPKKKQAVGGPGSGRKVAGGESSKRV